MVPMSSPGGPLRHEFPLAAGPGPDAGCTLEGRWSHSAAGMPLDLDARIAALEKSLDRLNGTDRVDIIPLFRKDDAPGGRRSSGGRATWPTFSASRQVPPTSRSTVESTAVVDASRGHLEAGHVQDDERRCGGQGDQGHRPGVPCAVRPVRNAKRSAAGLATGSP